MWACHDQSYNASENGEMLIIPKSANILLFITSFNNLSPKKPNCQKSLSQNYQLVSSHCSVKKRTNRHNPSEITQL